MLHPWPGTFLDVEGSPGTAAGYWGAYPGRSSATGDWGQREADGGGSPCSAGGIRW